jgi:oxepin-CoA hydrolase/3-oxo-5,6-dehydrosuberyl-CoA semialdehyde dehydrogenase
LQTAAEVVSPAREDLPAQGAFLAPTLLEARDASADVLHELEVFGPVATLIPYECSGESSGDRGALRAAELVNRGGGGLVVSAYSNDADWTEAFTLAVAPWHGRVWIGSDRVAEQTLPPGMVLPAMIHGGPGRAGGGEELGGERGLALYMQRVALQGFQGFLQARFGE